MSIELILGDCLIEMKKIPDKSVDLVLTDPPYGVGFHYNSFIDTPENLKVLIDNFMPEALRIGTIVAVMCGVKNMWLYPKSEWCMPWVCPAGTGVGPYGFNCWTPVLIYGKDPYLAKCKGSRPDVIITKGATREGIAKEHPCVKPLSPMKWFVERLSVAKGDTILDPFMGSGTTGVACKELGRNFIGIEISEQYFNIAQKRITQATQELFI